MLLPLNVLKRVEQTSGTIEAALLLRFILQLYLWSAEAEFRVTCGPGGFACPGGNGPIFMSGIWGCGRLHCLLTFAHCDNKDTKIFE